MSTILFDFRGLEVLSNLKGRKAKGIYIFMRHLKIQIQCIINCNMYFRKNVH